ncbi:MAG: DUF2892 domain-containing protein [Ruminococcaceae bacterium]|nr:DUF2892 domain-containing protein [Oscillospiraceae bacterium]
MKKINRIERIIRIVFGALFLIFGLLVQIILSGSYTFVSVVLYINGVLCIASSVIDLVKISRAAKAEEKKPTAEKEKQTV